MKQFWLVCITAVFVSLQSLSLAKGDEPHQQFLEALRTNGYYDYALMYLDQLAKKPGVPQELRNGIDFERANTMIKQATIMTNPDLKQEKLKQAETHLKKFLKEHPSHPLVARAQTEQGSIFLNRARVANYMASSPAIEKDLSKQRKLRQQARTHVAQAKAIFEKARVRYEKESKKFPAYIPPEEKARKAASKKATNDFIFAQFNVGLCLYEEAHTYSVKDKEFKRRLMIASKAFEPIHTKYRDWAGGLYARMWQAKCYEEQDSSTDIRRALGIYNELLNHGKDPSGKPKKVSPALKRLQDQVVRYRFICLNHSSKKDYLLVINEANQWLAKNRGVSNISNGIRWEKALAEELLGQQRDLTEPERRKFLQDAREDAERINRYAGKYKDISTAMIQRINIALGQKGKAPKNFDMAISQAETAYGKISELDAKLEQEKEKKKKEILESELNSHLQETAKKLRLTLAFVDYKTSPKQIHQVRTMLGHVLFLLKENYEAAVYSGYVADNARKVDDQIALQAAELSSIIWISAYYTVPKGIPDDFEKTMLKKSLERIITHWADSKQAATALMNLGKLYTRMNQHGLAAKQYNRIPKKSLEYATGQYFAGIAFLNAYSDARQWDESEHPDKKKKMELFKTSTEKHLRLAVNLLGKEQPAKKPISDNLASAKLNLAIILSHRSQHTEAVQVLVKEPHSVLQAIRVKNEKSRPKEGVKSKGFATDVYQRLLFSYISISNVKKASEILKALEKVGGKADTSLYVRLGRKLSDDIEQLKKEGDLQELNKVRSAFEKFLDTLSDKKTGQTYQSLIWVAETYNGLGKGSLEDPQASKTYFSKAAVSYKQIIDRAKSEGEKFLDNKRVLLVKLRLVNCWREEGQFQKSFDMAEEIVKAKPKNLDTQIEMARLLQSWGTKKDASKLLVAIQGNTRGKKSGQIWGWGYITNILQSNLNNISPTSERAKEYEEKWIDASYQSTLCRFEYAKSLKNKKKSKKQFEAALSEIRGFVSIAGELKTDDWNKFDKIYQNVQRAKGASPVLPLKRPKVYTAENNPNPKRLGSALTTKSGKKKKSAKIPIPPTNWTWVFAVLGVVVVFAGGLVFVMIKSKKSSVRPTYSNAAPDLAAFETTRKQAAVKRENTRKRASAALKKRSSSATATKRRPSQSSQAAKPKRKRREETE